ncbi:hypothetical protein Astex_0563 [Asticcacaulis excentricus CB 48]|uniref:Uncharacterized protein n=1 Tax=Asticcacaulis excentricus (strain ATCC 15261 / DSM 4724 / KCTC 12464 / NCIMB 9791 / VKM B-1370 / CB 48) TaxID=573065 RepID=E8RQY9_ASTEC|nr:hypothetical protein Astex_0563 [Asticcacaulis excentricus CB 48]
MHHMLLCDARYVVKPYKLQAIISGKWSLGIGEAFLKDNRNAIFTRRGYPPSEF